MNKDYYQFYFGAGAYENTVAVRKNHQDINDFVVGIEDAVAWREMIATSNGRTKICVDKFASFRLEITLEPSAFWVEHYRRPLLGTYLPYPDSHPKQFDTLAEAWDYVRGWKP